ncbi:MAG: hypothetical protein Q4D62_15245 [Planctomycetia bacterium]|nr:hypothetical protein [Planctomycetia bacterium]
MRRFKALLAIFLTLGAVGYGAGCQPLAFLNAPANRPLQESSFLTPQKLTSAQSVCLEVFIVRCPYGDTTLNRELWKDADEQILSTQLRTNMAANGFRMGLLSNQVPNTLLKLMNSRDDDTPQGNVTTIRLEDFANTPRIMRKSVEARNHQRNEVHASDVKPYATILFNENGISGGETFANAQGVFVIKTQTRGDGSIDIEILPELQYGQVRQQYSYDSGSVVMAPARPKKIFDSMRAVVNVKPGEIIAITNIGDLVGNLGYFFFSDEESDMRYQKLLCIRVSQSEHHEMFQEDGSLPMDPALLAEKEPTP